MGRMIKSNTLVSVKDKLTGGFKLPSGTTAQRSDAVTAGKTRYNTSTQRLEYYNGSTYKDIAAQGNTTITKDSFTGDGSTTVYALGTSPSNDNNVLVFVGNVFQEPTVKYTISGSTLTFSSPPPDGQAVVIMQGFDSTVVS